LSDPNTLYPQVDEPTTNMSVAISGTLEKLPSSCMKWQQSGWKKRFIIAKSNPFTISWADKEGKPASGQLEITPGSTLTVGDLQRGAIFAFAALHRQVHIEPRVPLACGRLDDPHL